MVVSHRLVGYVLLLETKTSFQLAICRKPLKAIVQEVAKAKDMGEIEVGGFPVGHWILGYWQLQ